MKNHLPAINFSAQVRGGIYCDQVGFKNPDPITELVSLIQVVRTHKNRTALTAQVLNE